MTKASVSSNTFIDNLVRLTQIKSQLQTPILSNKFNLISKTVNNQYWNRKSLLSVSVLYPRRKKFESFLKNI